MNIAPVLCAFLGFLLLRSAAAKLRNPAAFQSILERYPGAVRLRWLRPARLAPWFEFLLAAGLLLPLSVTRAPSAWGTLFFLLLASAAIFERYRRGEERFACGCSAEMETEMPALGILARNGMLLLASAAALAGPLSAVSLSHYGLGLALLLALDLVEAALAQEGRIRAWKARG